MQTGDSRKTFILSNIRDFFVDDVSESKISPLYKTDSLNTFLDNQNCGVLCAYVDGSGDAREVILCNKVEPKGSKDRVLIFFKRYPETLTPDNLLSNIFISSIIDSPISSFYHTLRKVFAPILLTDERWNKELDPKLQNLLNDLETGLAVSLQKNETSEEFSNSDALSIIFTPVDEYNYWKNIQESLPTRDQKNRAEYFCSLLSPLEKSFKNTEVFTFSEFKENLDVAYNALDDLWKQDKYSPAFPFDRMEHLLDIIGNVTVTFIQNKLGEIDLWMGKFSLFEDQMQESIDLCESWLDICQKLTALFWPNYGPHPWKKSVLLPNYLVNFCQRLNELLVLRRVHNQLNSLLTSEEKSLLDIPKALKPLLSLNPLNYNPYTEALWRASVAQYEENMTSAKKTVASKLRDKLRSSKSNPLQLVQEFKSYEELIRQPGIKEELTSERELLLGQLTEYMKTVRKDFLIHSGGEKDTSAVSICTPELINNITWIRQLDAKIREVSKVTKSLLDDIDGYQSLAKDIKEILDDFQSYNKEKFDNWSQELLDGLRTRSLGLDTGKPVISFNEKGQPEVSYSPRLVTLMREVRQLRVLGYVIPNKILDLEEKAKRHYSQAKTLQQIVHFYKTIADHMILSQQPMMLEAARAFTRAVDEKNAVTWDDETGLDAYISKLQQSVERLSKENRMLRKQHLTVAEMVLKLMSTDLLRSQQQWKDSLSEVRSIFMRLQEQGFSSENMRPWRAHWDRQLYKALEYQYELGLEVLNEHLPEIKVDLIYRNGCLQFRPPIEEIRAKYFNQMKKFISVPVLFKGVNDIQENLIFPIILERNSHSFLGLYKKTEDLFHRLEMAMLKFQEWVVFGSVNLEEFVSQHCQTSEDYKRNFKAIKAKSQEFSKMQLDEEKFDCITVCYAPVKAYIDYLISEVENAMIRCLQKSITSSAASVQQFLNEATDVLTRHPHSVEDITLATKKHEEFLQKRNEVFQECKELEAKNEFLGKWSRNAVIDLGGIKGLWDSFEHTLSDHHDIVEQQMEILKGSVSSQLKSYLQEEERFYARWNQMKPRNDLEDLSSEKIQDIIKNLKEKRAEFDILSERNNKLVEEIQHFNLPVPDFLIDELRADIEKTEEIWLLFDKFHTELQEFAKEEWIVFRGKIHTFESFLNDWMQKFRNDTSDNSTVFLRLHQDITEYLDIIPMLRYCRGDIFSTQHWGELFRILNLPDVSVELLEFGHFLQAKGEIKRNVEALKNLYERAQGEVTIREALNELDLWGAKARFSLSEHQDSTGSTLVLIKEWKDLLNKVGENQCLLQSLKDTAFYEHFKDRASIWDSKLTLLEILCTS